LKKTNVGIVTKEVAMNSPRFEGFSAELFHFLTGLAANNNKPWFDEHRREYESEVLTPIKAFVAEVGPILNMLNEDIETEPRVGRTVSRISNDMRFHKNRPPYKPVMHVSFPRRGQKWCHSALYAGIYPTGISVGFYTGARRDEETPSIQETIKKNSRLFQRYLDERGISESYSELAGAHEGKITKWPLPPTARKWANLDGFIVGEHFRYSERIISRRAFLDVAQEIFLDYIHCGSSIRVTSLNLILSSIGRTQNCLRVR